MPPFPPSSLHFCDYYTQINEKCVCNKDDDINKNVLFNTLSFYFSVFFCEYGTFPLYTIT